MKTVLLSYMERKKLVPIPDEKEESDLVFLEEQFRKLFTYESNVSITISFQRYNEEWGDCLELTDADTIENKDKLLVVVTPRMVTPVASCRSTESTLSTPSGPSKHAPRQLDIPSDSDSEYGSLPSSSTHRKRQQPVLSDSDDEQQGTSSLSSGVEEPQSKKKKTVLKCEEDAIPLPDPFPLPKHYGTDVECALKDKKMTKVTRQAFIGKVASAMLFYKRYPTSDDYHNVGRTIIQKYPFMKSPAGSPAGAIIISLKNAFKEFRRDKSKKRVKAATSSATQVEKPRTPGRDVHFSIPAIPIGEDEVSCRRNLNALQAEYKKQRHNPQVVDNLMAATFAFRRKDILDHDYGLKTLLEKYPFLQCTDQLMKEMQKIINDSNWISAVQCKWDEAKSKIFRQGSLEAPNKTRLRKIFEGVEESADESLMALVLLSYLLPDARCSPDHEKVVYFTEEDTNLEYIIHEKNQPQPYILSTGNMNSHGQLFLIVDCQVVGEIEIRNVPHILICAYFVYNICYVKGCNNLYSFLELFLLNSNPEKCSSSVKHFVTTLHHLE